MLVSNKHFTPVIGLDIHIVLLLGFPVPLPHPYIGFVLDPMDYVPFIGATTKINHVPRGKSDTSGIIIILFHIPMGGPFLLAPMIGHDSVNFFGSKKVKVEGNLMSPSGHLLMTCNDIGIPLSLTPGKKLIPIPSLYLPTSFSIPLSFGKPVNVGGPFVPDWAGALLNLIMSFGFGAMMKGLKKLGKKALTKFNHALKGKIGSNKLSRALCKKGFEPVDLVQGIVINDGVDFELPGPIPLKWERSWNSDSSYDGPLGHGVHFSYDMWVQAFPEENGTVVLLGDGRSAVFDLLPYSGNSDYNRHERLTLTRSATDEYLLSDHRQGLSFHFRRQHPQDEQFRLYAIRNEAGFMVSFHYNGAGRLVRIIDSAGRHLLVTLNDDNHITTVTARHGGDQWLLVQYDYSEAGDLTGIGDSLDQWTRIQYRDHLMTMKTDRNGQAFYWGYDHKKRCVHTWGDGGILEGSIAYHPEDGYNLVTNAQGHTTTYYYTPDFVVNRIKDPLGNARCFEYTEDFEIYREIDEEANVTGYTYDERGNCTSIIQPDGSAYTFNYDEEDRLLLSLDPQGNGRTYIYHAAGEFAGLLHTLTEADGSVCIFRYNAQKLLRKIEDEQEKQIQLEYDGDYNLAAITLQDGGSAVWEYNSRGQCIYSSNPLRQEQYFQYDALGRIIGIRQADGEQLRLQYNAYDDVLEASDRHGSVRFEYTAMGSLRARDENGTKVHFVYNRDEQLTGVVNEHGEMFRFTRNSCGDIIQETGFDGITRHYERDAAGRVIKVQRPGKRWTAFEYDYNGRLVRAEHHDGSWETYSYNRGGYLEEAVNEHCSLTFRRDALGRVLEEQQDGYRVNSIYDRNGRRKNLQSSLGANITVQRSATGDVTGIRAEAAGLYNPWQAHIERNMVGLEIERTLPGGVKSSWTYNQQGLAESHLVNSNERPVRNRHYRWDASQQLKEIVNGLQQGVVKFGYDDFDRLAWAQYENGQYDYRLPDKAGNLYQTQIRKDRQYGPGGKLLESATARFVYDEEGNLQKKITTAAPVGYAQWEYSWYGNGMLKNVTRPDGKTVSFKYDALGRRIEKQYGGQLTRFVWDGNVPLHEWCYPATERPQTIVSETGEIQQSHPEPVPAETLATWVFEEDSFIPAAKLLNGRMFSIITDHLGTPCEAYDEAGEKVWDCELDIYGKVRKLAGEQGMVPFRYQGQYEDVETGLYYNRYRYYSPEEGVYISQDPIGLKGGHKLYGYVMNTNAWVDIFGLDGLDGLITSENLKTLDLTGDWRSVGFDGNQEGMLYILKDADTGEYLKVGKTEANTMVGRFSKYQTAGKKTKRNLVLDVLTIDKSNAHSIEAVEKQVRAYLSDLGHKLPWDNTLGRLGRPGPGVPFTRLNKKLRQEYKWDRKGNFVPKCPA
ncbi:RHS repeat-associated core domain-containing protein [Chitinophaga varians]|uniref:RHS repeat-associated core domain-containing protein n=1 Tax=Chitinophaga varians TaxID=2202339 RepID=UPI00165ECCD0|nr:RHS repeat-associated core domain-containing protein [Chitinophaga varians]MBC9909424.1 RHS domain-containing protein [Chitinophaga varians]